jgi:kynurenine formamidase
VMIAEHLTNLSSLRGQDVEVFCGALNIQGGDGAPSRIVARPIAKA